MSQGGSSQPLSIKARIQSVFDPKFFTDFETYGKALHRQLIDLEKMKLRWKDLNDQEKQTFKDQLQIVKASKPHYDALLQAGAKIRVEGIRALHESQHGGRIVEDLEPEEVLRLQKRLKSGLGRLSAFQRTYGGITFDFGEEGQAEKERLIEEKRLRLEEKEQNRQKRQEEKEQNRLRREDALAERNFRRQFEMEERHRRVQRLGGAAGYLRRHSAFARMFLHAAEYEDPDVRQARIDARVAAAMAARAGGAPGAGVPPGPGPTAAGGGLSGVLGSAFQGLSNLTPKQTALVAGITSLSSILGTLIGVGPTVGAGAGIAASGLTSALGHAIAARMAAAHAAGAAAVAGPGAAMRGGMAAAAAGAAAGAAGAGAGAGAGAAMRGAMATPAAAAAAGGGGGIASAIGSLFGSAAGGPLGALAMSGVVLGAYKFWNFSKESVQYWREVEKSTLTIATNVGGTTKDIEEQNKAMREAGRGTGFTVMERVQFGAAMARAGYAPELGMSAQAQTFARAFRLTGQQSMEFLGSMGPLVGARQGGRFNTELSAAAVFAGGMRHDPLSAFAAQRASFGEFAQQMGPLTADKNQGRLLSMLAGYQATSVGEGQGGVRFAQQIGAGMQTPVGKLIMFDAIRRARPGMTFQQIEDQFRERGWNNENLDLLRGGIIRAAGGNMTMAHTILDQLMPGGMSPEFRKSFFDANPKNLNAVDLQKLSSGIMGTTAGRRAITEEGRTDLEYALGDRLGPMANFAADALQRIGNSVFGGSSTPANNFGGAIGPGGYLTSTVQEQ